MNNKGFAITSILYGLMILFIMTLASLLVVLSSKKNKLESITDSIKESISYEESIMIKDESNNAIILTNNDKYNYYVIEKRGLYTFTINSNTTFCSVYLPADTYLQVKNNKLILNIKTIEKQLDLINCQNAGINTITLNSYYTSKE